MTMDIAIYLSYGVKRCLMQLAWLLMDDHLYIDASRAANQPRIHSIGMYLPMLFDCSY